ncbi:hypothetical protein INS49_005314 [Diaporthe citri]|uniref:uncharacterized protein n=1 Tax=Diaporthe citri TaxID=83186 RepID=UPI001C80E769|nr:uncharacterized protein INS49_005314 [Diaporthe citri]KAG6353833.1 hypothetical protein INS49_005314 [Diaporthe citri]
MVVVPSTPIIPASFNTLLSAYTGPVIFGPRSAALTANFSYAPGIQPSLRHRSIVQASRWPVYPKTPANASISDLTGKAASKANDLGRSLRLLRRGNLLWAFNYGTDSVAAPDVGVDAELIMGEAENIPAAGVSVWEVGA